MRVSPIIGFAAGLALVSALLLSATTPAFSGGVGRESSVAAGAEVQVSSLWGPIYYSSLTRYLRTNMPGGAQSWAYHHTYAYWGPWSGQWIANIYSKHTVTISSPSGGYHLGSYLGKFRYGPLVTGHYVEIYEDRTHTQTFSQGNPYILERFWGTGYKELWITHHACQQGWCLSTGLAPAWGSWLRIRGSYGSYGVTEAYAYQ